tara:strand:- start:51 stop:461 length:411 start_codon:yes stop_codon:yes gene_type:complete
MKNFNEFRQDQFQSIVENLSEEDKQYLMELSGDNPGLGMALLSGGAKLAKFAAWDAPKWIIKKGLQAANSKPARALYAYNAGKETVKSVKNKEPWYQTAAKGLQGYYAKKTGGWKRGLAGSIAQEVLPGDKTKSSD